MALGASLLVAGAWFVLLGGEEGDNPSRPQVLGEENGFKTRDVRYVV